jgi:hypothetical protein
MAHLPDLLGSCDLSQVVKPQSHFLDPKLPLCLPSGKLTILTKNYGKSPFLMGKSTINGHFQ